MKKADLSEAISNGDHGRVVPVEIPGEDTNAPTKAMPRRLSYIINPALERMDKRARGEEKPIQMPCGWEPLSDSMHGGWWPQEQYILVGNTGQGKTAFAMQAALCAARDGCPVLYVPLELDDTQLVARLLGNEARVSWSALLYGNSDALKEAKNVAGAFEDLPLYIREPGPIDNLSAEVKAVRDAEGDSKPMLVVLDFLQLVDGQGKDLRESIRTAAYQGTHIARKYNAAVLMLSSTSREHYATLDASTRQEKDKRHDIGEGSPASLVGVGKESGEIEYAASNLLVLCRDKSGCGWLAIAKSRAGQSEWLMCSFDGALGTFILSPAPEKETEQKPRPSNKYPKPKRPKASPAI